MLDYIKENLLVPFIVGLGALVTLASFVALVLTISPIQVLSPWSLTTDKIEYSLGETVNINSVGHKKFALAGESTRTLTCTTEQRTSTYDINTSFNPLVGEGEFNLNIPVVLPTALEGTPRTCRIDIDVKYPWYGFEANGRTNDFIIKE